MSERQANTGSTDVSHQDTASQATSVGLEENIAGALAYISIIGLVFYFIEKENAFVRFHAAQSIALSVVMIVAYIVLSVIGTAISIVMFSGSSGAFLVGSLFSLLVGFAWLVVILGGFVVWAYLVIRAYQGESPHIPIVTGFARKLV